jgi:flotillin
MDVVSLIGTLLFVITFFGIAGVFAARRLIHICGPNEALVFSGSTHLVGKRKRGYRVIRGGRGILIPLLETVDRIDLTNMIIEVSVTNAYSKGGIPLTVQGVANLKVASHEPALGNAIERFLTMERKHIVKIAKETLEGNLRGVLSQLTPEEVNEDKIAFAEKLLEEAELDLGKLGLALDTLKIQNVADDVGYLDSIGRKQSAEVIKRARIAEAEARAVSTTREAEQNQAARLAAIEAEKRVVTAETQRRIKDAQTRRMAMIAEEQGQVKALIARARADLKVQEARVEQVRRRLEADVIAPAEAGMQRQQSEAKGNSARIIEDGKATVAVLNEMIATWKAGGENARDIFLMQKLQNLMSSLVGTIDQVKVDKVTVLPAGQADATSAKAVRMVEELKGALGVDLPKLLETAAAGRGKG